MTQQTRPNVEDRKLISTAMAAPMLDAETETALARRWRDEDDTEALHQLTNAYMRLAISVAAKYPPLWRTDERPYPRGCDWADESRRAFRSRSWRAIFDLRGVVDQSVDPKISLCGIGRWFATGSTSSQKSLFFNLRRLRAEKERELDEQDRQFGLMSQESREAVASALRVPLRDVEMMEARLGGSDYSLNTTARG